jgi:hypothetical protein
MAGSAFRLAGPSIDATLHSPEIKDDLFQSGLLPAFARRYAAFYSFVNAISCPRESAKPSLSNIWNLKIFAKFYRR